MAAPTVRFRSIPISTAGTAIDTAAERIGVISGSAVLSTGAGNELDFGTVDISGGAANSAVKQLVIDYTADGGNTLVDTFKFWLSSNGWDQAGTVLKMRAVSGSDGTPSSTEEYIANATTSSYTFSTAPESEPGSANLFPTDEGSSMHFRQPQTMLLWLLSMQQLPHQKQQEHTKEQTQDTSSR